MESRILNYNVNSLRSNVKYSSKKDFANLKDQPGILKILVVGEMGVGKSSLCSKLVGISLMFRELSDPEGNYGDLKRVDNNQMKNHFRVNSSKESVTRETSFVLSTYLGKRNHKKVMIIDTPGFFDPQSDLQRRNNQPVNSNWSMTSDLTIKLKALGSLDGVILLMRLEDRLTSHFINSLKGILDMFGPQQRTKILKKLAICYSKCDESNRRSFKKKIRNRNNERQVLVRELKAHNLSFEDNYLPEIFF